MRAKALPELLTQAYLAECFSYDKETGTLSWKERPNHHFCSDRVWKIWNTKYSGKDATKRHNRGYRATCIGNKNYLTHRIVWKLVHGEDAYPTIDHINRDRGDNTLCNLRIATFSEQNKNMKIAKDNTSGVSGVGWHKASSKWRSRIGSEYLGTFNSLAEAITTRKDAEALCGYRS